MPALYALLVGIDHYDSPTVQDLGGCVNDARAAAAHLAATTAPGVALHTRLLIDGEATYQAVTEAVRKHLGQAGPEDTALLWFSGHGSDAAVPGWAWFREPTGRVQTLVCADSRLPGVPDLWDKELSALLDGVADRAGHVAAILDSCHSDGATRNLVNQEPEVRTRSLEPGPPRAVESLVPEVRERWGLTSREHVTLAACRSFETAQEMLFGADRRGVFSWALLSAMSRLDPGFTYRELLAAVRPEVEERAMRQTPRLRPAGEGPADGVFLDGTIRRPVTGMLMYRGDGGWRIDAGSVHGLPSGGGVRVAVRGDGVAREAAVTEVQALTSLVTPEGGWEPARDRQFPVVVTGLPLPPATVAIGGSDPEAVRRITGALAGSPHAREAEPGTLPDLRVQAGGSGRVLVTELGVRVADLTMLGANGPYEVVGAIEHLARFRLLSRLRNPATALGDPVRIEVLAPEPGQDRVGATDGELLTPEDGVYRLRYRWTGAGWAPPGVFIRLHNTTGRRLYCVLLDLAPRFRVHAQLFPGDFIGPGLRAAAFDGRRVRASLPAGMLAEPGAAADDRLKLIVAEEQFSDLPFLMPSLGTPVLTDRGLGRSGLLERLAGRLVHRDLDLADDGTAYDWTTATAVLRVEVPGPGA
ncbi:caspase family protein [Actinoplanes sp. NPDC051851]|uniref:caspase family protein n=1 Tax=Actinoplanes sp. NPDC051851 TaxID=3154753 RepID=UPI00343727BD